MANSSGCCWTVERRAATDGGADSAKDRLTGVAGPAFPTPILSSLIEIDAAAF